MFGPITVIISQKILFGARKMGTFWEESGTPNFSPIVYNMVQCSLLVVHHHDSGRAPTLQGVAFPYYCFLI
jgi:hypothetical protein